MCDAVDALPPLPMIYVVRPFCQPSNKQSTTTRTSDREIELITFTTSSK